MIEFLFVSIITVLIIGFGVVLLVRLLGINVYPKPEFSCNECDKVKITEHGLYVCQTCTDDIYGDPLLCSISRGTKECYKNARKAKND